MEQLSHNFSSLRRISTQPPYWETARFDNGLRNFVVCVSPAALGRIFGTGQEIGTLFLVNSRTCQISFRNNPRAVSIFAAAYD
eukprot:8647185-Lingulodinium_polyedra.AAC.1